MPRRKKEPEVPGTLKGSILHRVHALMNSRHVLLAPFPVDPERVYQCLWTPDESRALQLLSGRHNDVLTKDDKFSITGVLHGDQKYAVKVTMPRPLPLKAWGAQTIPFGDLPLEVAMPIAEWLPTWLEYGADCARMGAAIVALANNCRTWGQVVRLWPDLLNLLESKGRMKVERAAKQSAYPESVVTYDDAGKRVFIDGFRPENFAPLTAMLAECLMLPTTNGEHVATVSQP